MCFSTTVENLVQTTCSFPPPWKIPYMQHVCFHHRGKSNVCNMCFSTTVENPVQTTCNFPPPWKTQCMQHVCFPSPWEIQYCFFTTVWTTKPVFSGCLPHHDGGCIFGTEIGGSCHVWSAVWRNSSRRVLFAFIYCCWGETWDRRQASTRSHHVFHAAKYATNITRLEEYDGFL